MNAPKAGIPPGVLGVPHQAWMWTEAALSLASVAATLPSGSNLITTAGPKSIAAKRNGMVRVCLESEEYGWLAMMDSDMTCRPDAVCRLVRRLFATGADVVGSLYTLRPRSTKPGGGHPHLEAIWVDPESESDDPLRRIDTDDLRTRGLRPADITPDRETIDVDCVGTGLVVIRRTTLEVLEPPWFAGNIRNPGETNTGEDWNFCLRVRRELGGRVLVDTTVRPGHIGTKRWTYRDAVERSGQSAPAPKETEPGRKVPA